MPELYDNLGRKIDAAKMSIGELKGLVGTLMKSKVGPAKAIGGKEEKDATKTQDSNLELVKLFEDLANGTTFPHCTFSLINGLTFPDWDSNRLKNLFLYSNIVIIIINFIYKYRHIFK